jgi:hypothetical protein
MSAPALSVSIHWVSAPGLMGTTSTRITGALSATRTDVSLRVAYCGVALAAERIVISADGARWSSARLAFTQDDHGCEVAVLQWTGALARAVRAAASAADAAVAFGAAARRTW